MTLPRKKRGNQYEKFKKKSFSSLFMSGFNDMFRNSMCNCGNIRFSQLEDGGYHASGSSSISVGSASANTQGSDPNMQIYVSGQYEYYTDYQYKDSAHLATKNGNNSGAYHANISFDPGYNGVSKSLDSTHSFSCGYYNASKGIHVQYP